MMKLIKKISLKKPSVNYALSQPLFSESILQTNFYSELQKNGWCKIVADKPDSLFHIVDLAEINNRKRNKRN